MRRLAILHALGLATALIAAIAAVVVLQSLGAVLMKTLRLALALVCALALTACATTDFEAFAKAANDLDPGCYKNVEITVTPMLMFGWAIPVVSGQYLKTCNPDQARLQVLATPVGASSP